MFRFVIPTGGRNLDIANFRNGFAIALYDFSLDCDPGRTIAIHTGP